ncbi:MAG TPA: metalloregulator ArsR/SmtB family transcription factor [Arachnia sp.]|nr:metalloregulator ArsR/SmtB family transcription factor [Arachnia sp.]HMT86871.1 metalloregulator ArsR/SmtB family transcription factor [Arachnia sp.]
MVVDALNDALPIFRALGEPSRARIVAALIEREGAATVGQIQDAVGMPQSTVSRHLRILLDSRLLRVTRNGTQRSYHLDVQPEALAAVERLIAEVRACQTAESD